LAWAMLRGEEVLFTSGFAEELRRVVTDIGLKSLAELLGWEYRKKVSLRSGKRVTSVSCIAVRLNDLLEFLQPEEVITMRFYVEKQASNATAQQPLSLP